MGAFLGIDIGTGSIKALIIDDCGQVLGSGSENLDVSYPQPLWAEQDPLAWWGATQAAIKKAINGDKKIGEQVKAIGLAGQMLGSVFMDKNHHPLMPCIIWQDQRAETEKGELIQKVGLQKLLDLTANDPLSSYWAPKILWLKKNRQDIFQRIDKILFPKDYIRFRLSGEIGLEVSDAIGSYLFDVRNRRWSDELFDLLDIPRDFVGSRLFESQDIAGVLRKDTAREIGLPGGIPIIAGGGDQPAGGVGNGVIREGIISSTIGTSGVVFTCSDHAIIDTKSRAATSLCHAVKNKWAFLGCTITAGGSLKWLRDQFAWQEKALSEKTGQDPYSLMTLAAEKARPGSGGLVFLPYLNGERTPCNDTNARGVFWGLTLKHGWPEMVRSVLEGVTFSMRDTVEIFREYGMDVRKIIASGGGARSRLWRQIQADIYNAEVVTINFDEGPAAGAAILASVGAGCFHSVEEACDRLIHPVSTTEPIRENSRIYDDLYGFYQTLYPSLKNSFAAHAAIDFKVDSVPGL